MIRCNAKHFSPKHIYQYADGTYLPLSSQPSDEQDYIQSKIYTPHTAVRFINITLGNNGIAQTMNENGVLQQANKPLPNVYTTREQCCGCTACQAICPTKAIAFKPDEEGFLYPVVNAIHCIRCYHCIDVCMFKQQQKLTFPHLEV